MSRIWHIRQSDEPPMYGMGYKNYESEEENEAYECGYKEGYADAMEEVSGMGYRGGMYERRGGGDMGYRRRRDSRGRYM